MKIRLHYIRRRIRAYEQPQLVTLIYLGALIASIGIVIIAPSQRWPWEFKRNLKYQPIDTRDSKDGLRLLLLEPGSGSDFIRGRLVVTSFSEVPTYSALSYTWGDSSDTKFIVVDGFSVKVTKNLWTALHHLRHKRYSQKFWIDSICIDQNNPGEKAHQIPIMSFIYERAREVNIWLGEHQNLDATCDLETLAAGETSYTRAAWSSCRASVEHLMYHLIHEEYWKRTWIIQEIGMANDNIKVHFGKTSLLWNDFLALVKWYQGGNPADPLVHYVLKLGRLRESRHRDGETYYFADLLNTFRHSFCSIVHDKIYAFLGMARENTRDIGVNYTKTVFELYQDVIYFQNSWTSESSANNLEMVYMSALVRRTLSRESGKQPKDVEYTIPNRFMSSHEVWKNWYTTAVAKSIASNEEEKAAARLQCKISRQTLCDEVARRHCTYTDYLNCEQSAFENCQYDRQVDCDHVGETDSLLAYLLIYMFSFPVVHGWIAVSDWLTILDLRKKVEYTMFWHPTGPEDLELWKPIHPEQGIQGIRIRGSIVGQVEHIGPLNDEILASFNTKKQWTASLPTYFPKMGELARARGQNERLMHFLEDPSQIPTRNIQNFQEAQGGNSREGPRIFLGSHVIAGTIPPGTVVGDTICQFWNSSASAVLRQDADGFYQVIGRAGIVQYGESTDWDVPLHNDIFEEQLGRAVDLVVDIVTLTRLSLDTVNFPFST
ncbi:hypothetical protein N431DRAFT_435819 [Stipitochalara longipes BDJ]|nr:hypothetical protein N431DRAFT_435819 [Stipitochalara longipes BDJ]